MSRGRLGGSELVARSLRVTRTTYGVVGMVNCAVAANAMAAVSLMGLAGQAALVALVFAGVSVTSMALCKDIFDRSRQTVSNLRSIGATTGSVSYALALAVVGYGVLGSALGAAAGAALGSAFGPGAASMALVTEAGAVVASSAVATAVGVYAGGRIGWPS